MSLESIYKFGIYIKDYFFH